MQETQAAVRTVAGLLKGKKYEIDYYQREYKWETKQVQELVDDLTTQFLEDYRPGHSRAAGAGYGHYFLGSIIISRKGNASYIVDGQQRLTSLTLLLIYLRNLQRNHPTTVNIDELIRSEIRGTLSFNLDIDEERTTVMKALFEEQQISDEDNLSESVRNIVGRYRDIAESFPEELSAVGLPHFIDWLTMNVDLVEIIAYSDEDAYTIFETMNDRGLSLSPTDMLKGFLLAKIADSDQRTAANDRWKHYVQELRDVGKETDADFFKAWLRSQYAITIRERAKHAKPGDFDRIGTEFHRWVRDHADERHEDKLVLRGSDDFVRLIERDFTYYAKQYLRLMEASTKPVDGLEHVLYNAKQGFTLQYMLLLAPLSPDDPDEVARKKIRLVAMYLDILLTRRVWNYHRNTYSSMYYGMFMAMREIRGLDPLPLAERLLDLYKKEQAQEESRLAFNTGLAMHQQNRWSLHLILARMTDYVERCSGYQSRYVEYVTGIGKQRYEVEHIWADKPQEHEDEFPDPARFQSDRNRLGGLLLLPKTFNASYGALPYEKKLPHYYKENLLASSLYPQTYDHNPGFTQFVSNSGLPFRPHPEFKKADLEARQELYRAIAEHIWNPAQLLREVE